MSLPQPSSEDGFNVTGQPGKDELLFVPLGGSGEIGMNLNLYGHDGAWLMVDMGITFADDATPGVDVITPDPAFIDERADDLAGLVLTHAHEDHLGAVQYLWDDYDCPIYATPFTAAVLRRKLKENDFGSLPEIIEIPLSGTFHVGPFDIELVTLTHSIPEPNALILRCPAGSVMHTGDWKLDPDPVVGPTTDEAALIQAGEDGILAMVCDSTNAMVPGRSGSEGDVRDALTDLIGGLKNRVAVACFASNIARVESIARAALANGRHPALAGRSLYRMTEAARETGYLQDLPQFLTDEDAKRLDPDKVLLICTGSQGEPRAALSRIARNDHPSISMGKGDTVIFSSREIPGNEVSIGRLQNDLTALGCRVVTAHDYDIHTSGHPNRDELIQMYQWIRPQIAVPVHGEHRHLIAQEAIARECQVPFTIAPKNGDVIRLGLSGAEVIDEVYAGRLALDGDRLLPMDSASIKERRRVAFNGCATVTIIVSESGTSIAQPQLSVFGLFDEEDRDLTDAVEAVERALERMSKSARRDNKAVKEAVRIGLRKELQALTGKRPPVTVHLVRV